MSKICTIVFTDGESVKLSYDSQLDPMVGAQLVEESLNHPYLAFEADGKLVIYPMSNIRSVNIEPAPEKLPRTIIRGATFI